MAKQLWFVDSPALIHRGNNDAKLNVSTSWWKAKALSETRGAASTGTSYGFFPVAGPTNGVEAVVIASGANTPPLEFISEPLSADFTISGTITANLWALENSMNDNAAANVVVEKIDGATGALTQIVKSANVTELGTSSSANNFTATPTSTACKRGDRLRVRVFIDDVGTMVANAVAGAFAFGGPTAAAAGDSWIQFTENLTFEPTGDPGIVTVLSQSVAGTPANLGRTTADQRRAQSFVAQGPTLTQISFRPTTTGSPADNLIVEIRADSGGVPSGTALATVATYSGATAGGAKAESVSIALTQGNTYWLVMSRSGAVDAVNYYNVDTGVNAAWPNSFSYNGTTWSASVSPFFTSLTFINRAAVSTYYLTDTAETINPGSATEKKALTTRGSGSVNSVTNTAAGPTTPILATVSGGGSTIEWYTPPLEAVTLGGKAKFNIRALESAAGANASLKADIAVVNGDGTSPVMWGIADIEANTTGGSVGELATADGAVEAWVSGDDVAVTAGQRLRFRICVDDCGDVPLVTGNTVTVSYNGVSAAATGDTYVILPVAVTEQSTGPTTWNSSAAVALTDALTTAAVRDTFTTAAVGLADTVTASGTRETLGAAAVAVTATVTTDGIKAVAGSAAVALTDTITTSGARTAVGASTVTATATVTTAGTREAIAQAAVALTDAVTTAGIREILGASAVALTGTVTTNGLVAALVVGSATVAVTASITTAGTRAAVSASTTSVNVTVTTAGLRDAVSSATVALTDAVATAGTRTTFSVSTVPLTVLITTSSIPGAFGSSTVALTATVTTAGTKEAVSAAAVQLTGTVTTDGISETGAQTYTSAAAVALTATVTAAGVRTAISTSQVTETVLVTSSATRDTFSSTATTETVTITTSAVPGAVGQATVQLTATVSTAGLRTAVTVSTTSLAVSVATAGTRVTSSSSTVPLTATVTTAGSRVVYGDIGTVGEHVAVVTDSKRDALTTSTVALHVTITTSAETLVPLPPGWISTTTAGRILASRSGSIDHPDQGDLAGTTAGRIAKVG